MDDDRLWELLGQAEIEMWRRMYVKSLMQVERREEREIKTNITDADMIKLHIDIALQNGDKEQFMTLTEQLRGLTQSSA